MLTLTDNKKGAHMAYAVQESTNTAAFGQLLAFQERSANEVCHRRHHAEIAAEPEVTRFRDKVTQARGRDDTGISR